MHRGAALWHLQCIVEQLFDTYNASWSSALILTMHRGAALWHLQCIVGCSLTRTMHRGAALWHLQCIVELFFDTYNASWSCSLTFTMHRGAALWHLQCIVEQLFDTYNASWSCSLTLTMHRGAVVVGGAGRCQYSTDSVASTVACAVTSPCQGGPSFPSSTQTWALSCRPGTTQGNPREDTTHNTGDKR